MAMGREMVATSARVATENGLVTITGTEKAVESHLLFVKRNARRESSDRQAGLREEVRRLLAAMQSGDIDPEAFIDTDVAQIAHAAQIAIAWLGTAAIEAVQRAKSGETT